METGDCLEAPESASLSTVHRQESLKLNKEERNDFRTLAQVYTYSCTYMGMVLLVYNPSPQEDDRSSRSSLNTQQIRDMPNLIKLFTFFFFKKNYFYVYTCFPGIPQGWLVFTELNRSTDFLELELQAVMSRHMGAGDGTQALCKSSKY